MDELLERAIRLESIYTGEVDIDQLIYAKAGELRERARIKGKKEQRNANSLAIVLDLEANLYAGQLIYAAKNFRALFPKLGLKNAKDCVEMMVRDYKA